METKDLVIIVLLLVVGIVAYDQNTPSSSGPTDELKAQLAELKAEFGRQPEKAALARSFFMDFADIAEEGHFRSYQEMMDVYSDSMSVVLPKSNTQEASGLGNLLQGHLSKRTGVDKDEDGYDTGKIDSDELGLFVTACREVAWAAGADWSE